MKFATIFALLLLQATAFGRLQAQETIGKSPEAGAKTASGKCAIKRTILPDGTVEVQNEDCTISRASKSKMLMPPTGKSATAEPVTGTAETKEVPAKESVQAGKLREMKPAALPPDENDPTLRAKYLEAMNGYFDYYTAGYVHRQKVFDWQLFSSKVIFLLVTLLVTSGVYFAALQFHEGMRRRAEPKIAPTSADQTGTSSADQLVTHADESTVTTFSASTTGISVSSPVLGVVILVISLAFFYLYLVYVYPITELF